MRQVVINTVLWCYYRFRDIQYAVRVMIPIRATTAHMIPMSNPANENIRNYFNCTAKTKFALKIWYLNLIRI